MQYIGYIIVLVFLMLSLVRCKVIMPFWILSIIDQGHFITTFKGVIICSQTDIWSLEKQPPE